MLKDGFISEEIISILLEKMKEIAKVKSAVIIVPTYFQYQVIKDTSLIADLNIIHFINSPITTAIAYGTNVKATEELNALAFDLDVSILTFDEGSFEVIVVVGNDHLDGKDFDNHLSYKISKKN